MIMIYDDYYIDNCVCCGSKAELKLTLNHTPADNYSRLVSMVYCPHCGRRVVRNTKETAISEWNKINKRNDER